VKAKVEEKKKEPETDEVINAPEEAAPAPAPKPPTPPAAPAPAPAPAPAAN
jgi:hypothetical protein